MKNNEITVQRRVVTHYKRVRYKKPYSRFYHNWWISKMLSMVRNEGLVLDNGCGIGILFEYLNTRSCKKHFKVIGLDFSRDMLSEAKSKNSNLVLGNSQSLPFRNGTFDIVFARSLLHHLPNPMLGLEEMARVLRENGELIIADPNKSLLSEIPRRLMQKREHFSKEHKNFKSEELIKLVNKYFKIDRVYYFGYLAYPLIGFPDIFDFFKYVPFKLFFAKCLVFIDQIISLLPGIKKQSWAVMLKGSKK